MVSDSLQPHGRQPTGSSVCGDSPGKNTGVGCHALLQGILPTQGSNPGLLQCRQILYRLSQQGSPRILEWVACPFSRGTSQPRRQAGVSFIVGRFFTSWATRNKKNTFKIQIYIYSLYDLCAFGKLYVVQYRKSITVFNLKTLCQIHDSLKTSRAGLSKWTSEMTEMLRICTIQHNSC